MEETVLVIMVKDPQTGFLGKELGSYAIGDKESLVYNAFALEQEGAFTVFLKLTCDREVEDWEFYAIYDYYDEGTLLPAITSIEEDEEAYDPTWVVGFPFVDSVPVMEEKLQTVLALHKQELDSVYEAIADQKDAYTSHEE